MVDTPVLGTGAVRCESSSLSSGNLVKEDTMEKEDLEIDIDKDTLFMLMLMAHEKDITLNQLVETILRKKLGDGDEVSQDK